MRTLTIILLFVCSSSFAQMLDLDNGKARIEASGCFVYQCGCGTLVSHKIIEIGDWDMNANDTILVNHGLVFDNIIGCLSVMIRNDANTVKAIAMGYDGATTDVQINDITATTIKLKRGTSSAFKSTDYDATSYNRGYIVLIYKK